MRLDESNVNSPHDSASASSWSNAVLGVILVLLIVFLVFSPYLTLPIFHPGVQGFHFPKKLEYFIDIQISQIEPLIISVWLLSLRLFGKKTSNRTAWIASIIAAHLFVAFWLISVRDEGGLRWLN
jgi:hypothetical protein